MPHEQRRDHMVLSYHRVRSALGLLGVVFPLLLIIGGLLADGRIHPSVSDDFHTTLRDVYVGALCASGVFLSYRGYQRVEEEWFVDHGGELFQEVRHPGAAGFRQ